MDAQRNVRVLSRDLSDADVLEHAHRRAPDAAGAVYDRFADEVNRIVGRVLGPDPDHDDIVQQVFVEVFRAIDSVRDPASLGGWVATIALRTVCAELRRRSFLRRIWARRGPVEVVTTGPDLEGRELLRRVYVVLDAMPVKERVAFVLRYVEQRPLAEVAELCECSLATIKRRLARAKDRFERRARRDPALLERFEGGA